MDFESFKIELKKEFEKFVGIELSENQCKQFFDFMNLLIEKNKVMNLTAITDPIEIIKRHFVDSSIPIKVFGEESFAGKQIIDVGTGAGFPGLPLAIILSDSKFVLTDTLGKRINFLSEVLDVLKLKNVILVKARAEDLAHEKSYREKFDFCISRGVARFSVLAEYSLPFVRVGEKMISFKMNDCDVELQEASKAISELGGKFHVKHPYMLIDEEPERCLVEIDKIKPTKEKYPRKAGTPSKEPL